MAREPLTELPELLHWLTTTIEPLAGQPWQITLNSSGNVVEATAKIVQHKQDDGRGNSMTITRVESVRFRLGHAPRRTVFSSE
jgi:hypothetical protein